MQRRLNNQIIKPFDFFVSLIFRCVSISINSKFTDSFTNIQTDTQPCVLLQPYLESRMARIVIRIIRIVTSMVRIITRILTTKFDRIWNYPNRKWNYFSNFQASDRKTSFSTSFSYDPKGSKSIFKTGYGIIQTGNGIISPNSWPLIKNFFY